MSILNPHMMSMNLGLGISNRNRIPYAPPVNAEEAALVAAVDGDLLNGTIDLTGGSYIAPEWGTEISPSNSSLAAVTLLERGWTVTVVGGVPAWVVYMVQLVTNRHFDSSVDGWTSIGDATVVWSDGEALVDITGVAGGIEQIANPNLEIGATYEVSFRHRRGTYTGTLRVNIAGAPKLHGITVSETPITTTFTFVADSTAGKMGIGRNVTIIGTMYFDYISYRRVA